MSSIYDKILDGTWLGVVGSIFQEKIDQIQSAAGSEGVDWNTTPFVNINFVNNTKRFSNIDFFNNQSQSYAT